MYIIAISCIILHFSNVHSQECKEVSFPPLPKFYTATLQYNVAHKERFNIRACVLRGNCAKSLSIPPQHDLGKSFSIEETIDARKNAAFLIMDSEFDDGNGTQALLTDKIIWNP